MAPNGLTIVEALYDDATTGRTWVGVPIVQPIADGFMIWAAPVGPRDESTFLFRRGEAGLVPADDHNARAPSDREAAIAAALAAAHAARSRALGQ